MHIRYANNLTLLFFRDQFYAYAVNFIFETIMNEKLFTIITIYL